MILTDYTKNTLDKVLNGVRAAAQYAFGLAMLVVLLVHGVFEFSLRAVSDVSLWIKVIRSNSIN